MSKQNERRILVIGATGMLGEPVARALLEAGHPVRLLVRNMDKAKEIFGDEVDYSLGNVLAPETLTGAMEDCDGVHISLSGGPSRIGVRRVMRHGVENVAEAAAKKGIRQLSLVGGATYHEPTDNWVISPGQAGEKALLEGSVPAVSFRCSWFYDTLRRMDESMGRIMQIGPDDPSYRWLGSNDLARMVVDLHGRDEALEGAYYALGPEEMSFAEAAKRYADSVPHEVKLSSMPFPLARLLSLFAGASLRYAITLLQHFQKVSERKQDEEAERIFGANETKLEAWVEQQEWRSGG